MCDSDSHESFMHWGKSVIELAISNINAGGLLFAAVIVSHDEEIIGKGVNQVSRHLDCSACGNQGDKKCFT